MFDIGFWELCLVGLVSLLVIGPERLPKAARIAGFWVGKARHTMAAVKTEINQEFHAEEMRQILEQQQVEMQNLQQEVMNETSEATEVAKEAFIQLDKEQSAQDKNAQ
ncbi:MAG: twin-arginine translocase subunit TatB [Methylococcaceae bacterium]|nr:twin-arginine translocase subunit TatB [Methylococcaceae bacterium]